MSPAITAKQIRRKMDLKSFKFKTTAELEPCTWIIGQPRGTKAIDFGINIDSPGYNIYVLGESGTGRTTAIKSFIGEKAATDPTPPDWAYVYNFQKPENPRALQLPSGLGCKLRDEVDQVVTQFSAELPRAFESGEFRTEIQEHQQVFEEKRTQMLNELQSKAREADSVLLTTAEGLRIVPARNGQPVPAPDYAAWTEEDKEGWKQKIVPLEKDLENIVRSVRELEKETQQGLEKLVQRVAGTIVTLAFDELLEGYKDVEQVVQFLTEMRDDILEHVDIFQPDEDESKRGNEKLALRRYKINVVVDHRLTEGAPVIVEYNPSTSRLLGRLDYESRFGGAVSTDFTLIRGGALHEANGGYLIVRAKDLFSEPGAWDGLKQALTRETIKPDNPATKVGVPARSLDPEPIPLDLKIVLIGPPNAYYALHGADEDFRSYFKVMADFDLTMERTPENEKEYALFVGSLCHEEGLRHFDPGAVGQVVEFSSRLAASQNKLSTQFGEIADLIREACHWTKRDSRKVVGADDVRQAIQEREYRHNRIEVRLRESILDRKRLIATEGEVVGQINGLSVSSIGDHAFGQPTRVTARTFVGKEGVLQIDRETELAGPIHNKGVMTLTGYLGGQYATDQPLSLSAQITFEQNYGGIEGDSASSTELYALLSSLSGIPIKQHIAVTGSVNQRGEIQTIGGVTEKVEGWFAVCKEHGLNGEQGAMIPTSNLDDLMVKEEIVNAVEDGEFHIWTASTVNEGLEIMTGEPAEKVHTAVKARLVELGKHLQEFNKDQS